METKHFVMEEAVKNEIDELFGVDSFGMCFKVMDKEERQLAGCVSLKMQEDSVADLLIVVENEFLELEEEVMESTLNHSFFRLNARKVKINCPLYDRHKQRLLAEFGFRHHHQDTYHLYREEYLRWLRSKGKTMTFMQMAHFKVMFMLIAVAGVVLLWVDLSQGRSSLITIFYTYITGIGVAGVFACSWMSAKRKTKERNHAG